MKKTKIIATIGPASESTAVLEQMVSAGMNIARLNFSHGDYKQFKKIVQAVRSVEKSTGKTISIMQDLQGPKIRLGKIKDGKQLVVRGDTITFSTKANDANTIHIPYPSLPKILKKGQALLIEDGLIRTKILSIKDHHVKAKVISGGYLKDHKGVNIPDSTLPPSASLTTKDKEDLKFGIKTLNVDAVAVSFVETADDILRVKKEIAKYTKRDVPVIAKIERREALKNLKKIVEVTDGLMVARGDLGIETKAESVPIVQRQIVQMARQKGKPVIIATQILQSMVSSPLATRAEVSDAATAIFELADAFMLSNETAVGSYPVKAVKTLSKVAKETEREIFRHLELSPVSNISTGKIPDLNEDDSIALNACVIAENINAGAIIVMTKHGFTASAVLKNRPKTPVIIVTDSIHTARKINFLWGVQHLVLLDSANKIAFRSEDMKNHLKQAGYIKKGQQVVVIKLSDQKRSLVAMEV